MAKNKETKHYIHPNKKEKLP